MAQARDDNRWAALTHLSSVAPHSVSCSSFTSWWSRVTRKRDSRHCSDLSSTSQAHETFQSGPNRCVFRISSSSGLCPYSSLRPLPLCFLTVYLVLYDPAMLLECDGPESAIYDAYEQSLAVHVTDEMAGRQHSVQRMRTPIQLLMHILQIVQRTARHNEDEIEVTQVHTEGGSRRRIYACNSDVFSFVFLCSLAVVVFSSLAVALRDIRGVLPRPSPWPQLLHCAVHTLPPRQQHGGLPTTRCRPRV